MVSVIIPNYNHASYLKDRINSVLNQTYSDFELIILDDCSTDNSKEIIEEYRNHPKISQIIFNDQNGGSPFLQWRKGIEHTKGEYIWIAESDDSAKRNFLENLVPEMDKNTSASFAFCQALVIDENNGIQGLGWGDINKSEGAVIVHNGINFLRTRLLGINNVYNSSKVIFRKSAYERISNAYLEYKTSGDWVFWIELSTIGSVLDIRKPLSYFRWHSGSATGKAIETGLNYIEAADIYEDVFKIRELTLYDKTSALINFLSFFYFEKKKREKYLPYFRKLKKVYYIATFILMFRKAKLKGKYFLKTMIRYSNFN